MRGKLFLIMSRLRTTVFTAVTLFHCIRFYLMLYSRNRLKGSSVCKGRSAFLSAKMGVNFFSSVGVSLTDVFTSSLAVAPDMAESSVISTFA